MNYLINQLIRRVRHVRAGHAVSLLLVLCALVTSCASVPHTGRRQFNFISDRQLNAIGLEAYREVVNKEQQVDEKRLQAIVERVANRVSKAAEAIDHPDFEWKATLIDKEEPNAFCLPGGKIVVNTGILPYAENEAGLAAIIAHEVAHAVARHGAERLSQKLALRGAMVLGGHMLNRDKGGELDRKSKMILSALGMGATVGVLLPYSRLHEHEADRIGQIFMAAAGYDPAEAVQLWSRMAKIKKPPIPVWLSTHPADAERIAKLREFLPDAAKYYQEAPEKYGKGVALQ